MDLLTIAKLTWPRVPHKGEKTFADYCKFLYEHKESIWTICSGSNLGGMIAAKNTEGTLYVTMFVTLMPGSFEEFISRANEFFGEIKYLSYLRRGRPVTIQFERFKRKALA